MRARAFHILCLLFDNFNCAHAHRKGKRKKKKKINKMEMTNDVAKPRQYEAIRVIICGIRAENSATPTGGPLAMYAYNDCMF